MEKIILTMMECWTNWMKMNAEFGEENLETMMLTPIVEKLEML